LFAEFDSTTPTGADTDTVFANEPVAAGDTTTVTVYVTEPPGDNVTVDDNGITPLAAPHTPPTPATHDHEPDVAPTGNPSTIDAPDAVDGPTFDATTVYTTLVPGTAEPTPSDFVTDRSTVGWATEAAVAELLAGVSSGIDAGPATVAVFDNVPTNVGASRAVMV